MKAFPVSDLYKKFSFIFFMNSCFAGQKTPLEEYDIWLTARYTSADDQKRIRSNFYNEITKTCREMNLELSDIVEKLSDVQKQVVSEYEDQVGAAPPAKILKK